MNKLVKLFLIAGTTVMFFNASAQDNPTSLKNISDKDALSVTKKLNACAFMVVPQWILCMKASTL
jgi:hypothetical protein